MQKNQIGFIIGALSHQIRRTIDAAVSDKIASGISSAQCHVIGFIARSEKPIYQCDIERHFDIRRSTATEMLQLMEKNGLLIRISDEDDGRKKQICLTDDAKNLSQCIEASIGEFETELISSLSPEETKELMQIIDKLRKATEKYDNKLKGISK